jgi:hypothetical protein
MRLKMNKSESRRNFLEDNDLRLSKISCERTKKVAKVITEDNSNESVKKDINTKIPVRNRRSIVTNI